MTSKNSYFSFELILDRIRKNAWIVTLYSIVLFFAMPVYTAIRMQDFAARITNNQESYVKEIVLQFFTMDNKFILFMAIPAAIIAAATVFYYLTSKKQMDFYHSLPVRREKLFVTNYLAGLVFYIIPYAASVILSLIVVGAMGYISYLTPNAVINGFLVNVLFYMVLYTISVFAMILCGNFIVGLLGTVVFLAYGPLICIAYTEITNFFYKNFYSELFQNENFYRSSSPVLDFMIANPNYNFSPLRVISYILLIVILVGVSLHLYKKRPSEAAGHAMAFKLSEPIIKYPIVFVCTLIAGIFFMSAGRQSLAWMIFGFVCGGVISHFIIEIIYNFDFKAIFKNIKGLGAFALLFAIFISIPGFDITGYDSRLPKREDIESVSISIMNFNQNSYFMNINTLGQVDYRDRERKILDTLTFNHQGIIDNALEIAKMGTLNNGLRGNDNYARVGVEFKLKNGTKIARRYVNLKTSEIEPHVISIFNTNEFKQRFYSLYSIQSNEVSQITIENLFARNGMNRAAEIMDSDKITSLIDAIRVDMLSLKGQDMKSETPLMMMRLINGDPKERVIWQLGVPIYKSFTQTMVILKSLGVEEPKMIPGEMVDFIDVNNYEYEKYMVSSYGKENIQYAKDPQNSAMKITDKNEILQVLKNIVPEDVGNYNPFFLSDMGYRVNIVSSKYLNGYSEAFVFMKDKVPEFIKEKFNMPKDVK